MAPEARTTQSKRKSLGRPSPGGAAAPGTAAAPEARVSALKPSKKARTLGETGAASPRAIAGKSVDAAKAKAGPASAREAGDAKKALALGGGIATRKKKTATRSTSEEASEDKVLEKKASDKAAKRALSHARVGAASGAGGAGGTAAAREQPSSHTSDGTRVSTPPAPLAAALPPPARDMAVSDGGFQRLPVLLGADSRVVRTIWIRPQEASAGLPEGRTLFLSGVPAGAARASLLSALSSFGPVASLAVHGSGVSAAAVFADEAGLEAALAFAEAAAGPPPPGAEVEEGANAGAARGSAKKASGRGEEARNPGQMLAGRVLVLRPEAEDDLGTGAGGSGVATPRGGARQAASPKGASGAALAAPSPVVLEDPRAPLGLKAWVEAHKALTPGNAVLAAELDAWTEDFEDRLAEARRAHEASLEEEGWTVVKKRAGGKRSSDGAGLSVAAVSATAARAAVEAAAKRTQEAKLADFYRFQTRDARRNELVDLRKRFEEDKRRVAELRAQRKFTPL